MANFFVRVLQLVLYLLPVVTFTVIEAFPDTPNEVDFRQNRCMPPIAEDFTYKENNTDPRKCKFTSWALPAVAMTEYIDCMSSSSKTLRHFSAKQIMECALPYTVAACNLSNYKTLTSALDYLIYAGVSLKTTYDKWEDAESATIMDVNFCHANRVDVAYQLKEGYRNLKPFDEAQMASVIKENGPILTTLYVNITNWSDEYQELFDYTSGILYTEDFCPELITDFSYTDMSQPNTSVIQFPVMIVGYGIIDGVDVWILRNDWFGPKWGMNGYFYLKRGINECNIALSPIRVLGKG